MKLKAFILGLIVALPILISGHAAAADVPESAEWNVLFFLNGKNNLQSEMQTFLLKNLYAMSDVYGKDGAAGKNIPVTLPGNVNILVEYGTLSPECDPNARSDHDLDLCRAGVKRFRMIKGLDQVAEPDSAFQNLGDVDMGDANSLVDFANWSRKFPARHTMLYIFDHGSDYEGASQGLFSFDDESKHAMNARQIADGFRQMAGVLGQPIDLFVTDMCMVGSAEALGQMASSLRFYVASRESVNGYSIDVIDILRVLEQYPTIDAKKWAYQIVLQANHYATVTNFSAFNLGGMADFDMALSDMVSMLKEEPPSAQLAFQTHFLKECHFSTIDSENSYEFRDVLDCFSTMPGFKQTREFQALFQTFFQVMYTNSSDISQSGMSIWGGQYRSASATPAALADYRTLLFDRGSHWSDFIELLGQGRSMNPNDGSL